MPHRFAYTPWEGSALGDGVGGAWAVAWAHPFRTSGVDIGGVSALPCQQRQSPRDRIPQALRRLGAPSRWMVVGAADDHVRDRRCRARPRSELVDARVAGPGPGTISRSLAFAPSATSA